MPPGSSVQPLVERSPVRPAPRDRSGRAPSSSSWERSWSRYECALAASRRPNRPTTDPAVCVTVSQGRPRDTPAGSSRMDEEVDEGDPPVTALIPPPGGVALHDRLEETDRGLVYDLSTLIDRRQLLKLAGFTTISAGLMSIAACAPAGSGLASSRASSTASAGAAGTAAATSCAVIPQETGGPFPGDGSNGPNVLAQSGIVRQDIRSSFGSSSTVAAGVPLTIDLTIQDAAKSCAPLSGAAVYLWHCDRNGAYSLYSNGVTGENYLRGVQAADSKGLVTFKSIFPACYSGRWPHIHFEVYPNLDAATDEANKI